MRPGGKGALSSAPPGSGGLNPLKTPGGASPSGKGYPRAPRGPTGGGGGPGGALVVGGEILAAPGDELGNLLLSFFFLPAADALEAGVDLPEAGLSGSFLLPGPPPSEPAMEPLADPTEAPFSLGDLVPLVGGGKEPGFDPSLAAWSGSSTTKSWSSLSPLPPSLSSFFNFLESDGESRVKLPRESPGEMEVLCKKRQKVQHSYLGQFEAMWFLH